MGFPSHPASVYSLWALGVGCSSWANSELQAFNASRVHSSMSFTSLDSGLLRVISKLILRFVESRI